MTRFIDQHRERFGVEPIGWTLEHQSRRITSGRAEAARNERWRISGWFRRIEEVHQANWEADGNGPVPA
jgi:hypothetical protein